MNRRNRRQFMEESMVAAAAAVASGSAHELFAADEKQSSSPNEKLGVAVVGVRGRGGSHIGAFAGRKDTDVLYVCDADLDVGARRARETAKRQRGRAPRFEQDIRRVLEDPKVDIVSIATPHHWHALAAVWSMQAGKDVYLEKPVSHNISEGRRVVEAARRYRRICQTGAQCRSNPGVISAVNYVLSGKLGRVKSARGICHRRRRSIGPRGLYSVPSSVNYDLWLGPAPAAPLTRPQLHYDWHWQWPYGNGDLGHEGFHQIDLARWGLGKSRLSERVISYGGRVAPDDAGEPGCDQVVVHDYGDASLVFEVRSLETSTHKGANVRVIFEGTEGYVVITGHRSGAAFDPDGNKLEEFCGGGGNDSHFGNFLQAVRSRKLRDLNADVEEGHLSSALCHMGNISYRLGATAPLEEALVKLASFGTTGRANEMLERAVWPLRANDASASRMRITVGLPLVCDAASETFVSNEAANQMLAREYRKPFVVPAAGSV